MSDGFSKIRNGFLPVFCIAAILFLFQTSNAQSGRKKDADATPTEPPVAETVKTEPQKTEPKVLIKSLKIVAKLEHNSGYFRSNDLKDAMKELERDLSLRYQFSLNVTRGEKMDFEQAKELAKQETETYILWIGFVANNYSSGTMYFDFANYALLAPQTAQFVTRGRVEPKLPEFGNPGGVLQLPTTRTKPSLSYGMKDSVRQISWILQKGGWFD